MITEAILKINKDAQVNVHGSDLDTCTIEWLDGTPEISKADIQAKIDETKYQRDRAKEYPTWQEQMDMQYHDTVNGTTNWQDVIAKVKSDNPKS